jgi:tRNA A-37 threonylcarbamoyl transferase component Bud32
VTTPRIVSELPDAFAVTATPDGVLALRRSAQAALAAAGFSLEADGGARESDLAGRAALRELEAGGERFVLRRFTHGGLLRWLTGARFLDSERPFRELVLSERLRQAGIATPEVVAARARRLAGGGWRLDLVTRRVERVLDLGAVVERASRGEVAPSSRTRIYGAAGELVARLHALGFVHADLHPRNLYVDESALAGGAARVGVLDLDRSAWRERLDEVERLANLRRLYRYVARRREQVGWRTTRTDAVRFLRGYRVEREARKSDWRAVERLHRRSRPLHAGGWALERGFARRR